MKLRLEDADQGRVLDLGSAVVENMGQCTESGAD